MAGLLICTDLDRTLIPNGPQPESSGVRDRFAELVARPEVLLAYVSGRSLDLVLEAMREYGLPRPDFVIGDVGTSIHRCDNGEWRLLEGWHETIAPDWAGADRARIESLLADIPGLRLQEPSKQERFKVSYYVDPCADTEAIRADINERLGGRGIRARLIFSVDEPRAMGLLDVLPSGASKSHAIEFLLKRLELGIEDCLFAGDSGNDLEVLVSPIPSVLVANASEQVRRDAIDRAGREATQDRLYCATGGLDGMNGNYAAGILEGVAHFHPQFCV